MGGCVENRAFIAMRHFRPLLGLASMLRFCNIGFWAMLPFSTDSAGKITSHSRCRKIDNIAGCFLVGTQGLSNSRASFSGRDKRQVLPEPFLSSLLSPPASVLVSFPPFCCKPDSPGMAEKKEFVVDLSPVESQLPSTGRIQYAVDLDSRGDQRLERGGHARYTRSRSRDAISIRTLFRYPPLKTRMYTDI